MNKIIISFGIAITLCGCGTISDADRAEELRIQNIENFYYFYADIPKDILDATYNCSFSVDSMTLGECIDYNLSKTI